MKNTEIIRELQDCATSCNYCADACLDLGADMAECIRTDRACAIICEATAKLLAQNQFDASKMLDACIDVCKQCGEECAKHDHDHCKNCADRCKKCQQACEDMLSPA